MIRLPESIFLHLCVLSLNVFLEMGLTNLPNANLPTESGIVMKQIWHFINETWVNKFNLAKMLKSDDLKWWSVMTEDDGQS